MLIGIPGQQCQERILLMAAGTTAALYNMPVVAERPAFHQPFPAMRARQIEHVEITAANIHGCTQHPLQPQRFLPLIPDLDAAHQRIASSQDGIAQHNLQANLLIFQQDFQCFGFLILSIHCRQSGQRLLARIDLMMPVPQICNTRAICLLNLDCRFPEIRITIGRILTSQRIQGKSAFPCIRIRGKGPIHERNHIAPPIAAQSCAPICMSQVAIPYNLEDIAHPFRLYMECPVLGIIMNWHNFLLMLSQASAL